MHDVYDRPSVDLVLESRSQFGLGGRWFGIYPAPVSDIRDPDGSGKVKVTLPWSPDTSSDHYEAWARVATMMGGNNRGSWFIPDVNDEVLVAFEAGDPRRPYVLGGLWKGSDQPPQSMDGAGQNNVKVLCSRNGVKITLDDTSGRETFVAETPGGQKITLQDGPGSVMITDSNGNSVNLQPSGITVNTSAVVTVTSSLVQISAPMLMVSAGMSIFSGVIPAETVITNSVVSASYTPGAGNIW